MMKRRVFVHSLALSALAGKVFAQDNSVAAPAVRTDQKTSWSVLDFQGSTFRAKFENAVREAAGSGINVQLPGGSPLDLDAPIDIASQDIVRVAISGEGMASTVIRCDGVGVSLSGAPGSQYSFRGMSFVPQRANQGTALKLEWAKAGAGKGFSIEDVGFGSNSPNDPNFFIRGLEVRNKGNGQIIGCWFNGLSDADPQGEGLVLSASNDVEMISTHMYNLAYGCRSDGPTTLEGFKLHGCYLVRVGHGLFFEAKPLGIPYIEVALSHINACYEGIHIKGYGQVNIVDNLIYGRNDIRVGNEQTDILIDTCPAATIARNKFYSGMDRSKVTKTAIKATGSIHNTNISDNLVSERTIFLDVGNDSNWGAQDIVISKNRPERDLKGNVTVSQMYRFTNSPLHKRIKWHGDDLATIGSLSSPLQIASGKWQVMPFAGDKNAEYLGIDIKPAEEAGEFIVPAGVTDIKIDGRVHLKGSQEAGCDLRIMVNGGGGFKEVAFGSAFGDEVSVSAECDVLPVSLGSRIRVEIKSASGGVADASPLMTRVMLTPS